jgi:gliding motility-associated-like protein
MFYLTASAFPGCSKTDSVLVTVRSSASFGIETPAAVCKFDSVRLNAYGGDIYLWNPGNDLSDPNIFNPWASPTVSTMYSVQITDTLCDQSETLSVTVNVWPLPNINAQRSNDLSCSISESQLSASGGIAYSWSPTATLNNPTSSNPVAFPLSTTQYFVTGIDANGCTNRDSVMVEVDMTNLSKFLMPSAFTPNSDGLNDCFGFKFWGAILEVEFNVYNRWGEKIFHTRNPTECWDGTFRGIDQPVGVYVYWIKARTNCVSEVFRKGTITLIR